MYHKKWRRDIQHNDIQQFDFFSTEETKAAEDEAKPAEDEAKPAEAEQEKAEEAEPEKAPEVDKALLKDQGPML